MSDERNCLSGRFFAILLVGVLTFLVGYFDPSLSCMRRSLAIVFFLLVPGSLASRLDVGVGCELVQYPQLCNEESYISYRFACVRLEP